ncbi:MAG TPA: recombinase family protein [Actinopolymorphaceae bacterium]
MVDSRRAVIYARISKDPEGTREGVDRQMEDARTLACSRGWTVVDEFIDNDAPASDMPASGKKRKSREGFDAVIEALQSGRADTVLSWTMDRLTRNARDRLRLFEVCQQAQAFISLVRGPDIDMSTPAGRFIAAILAEIAQHEVEVKADRQRRAARQRAEQGRPPMRRAYGYQADGTPDPHEAPVVRELFSKLLAGATISGLTRWLNDIGETTTTGKAWDRSSVRKLLLSPRYAGMRVYAGEIVGEGDWPAIVSEDVLSAARVLLTDPSRLRDRPARKHLGGGLYRCHCGAKVRVNYTQHRTRVYQCSERAHLSRSADPIDDYVSRVIVERLRRPDVVSLLEDSRNAEHIRQLRSEAHVLRARLDGLAADYADGALTARQVQVATQRITQRLQQIDDELAREGRRSALAAVTASTDPGAMWMSLPVDSQRAVVDALCTVVILTASPGRAPFDPDTVRIDWKN